MEDTPRKNMYMIYHLSCPSCGGRLHIPEGTRVIQCPYCGGNNVLLYKEITPRYYIPSTLNRGEAMRTAREVFESGYVSPALSQQAMLLKINLFFVPFYETIGKRLGTLTTHKETDDTEEEKTNQYYTLLSAPKQKPNGDTRIEFKDFYYSGPGVLISQWNLEKVKLGCNRREMDKAFLLPFDILKMQLMGSVLNPAITRMAFEKRHSPMSLLRPAGSFFHAEQRVRVIYYPLWVVKYSFHNRLYQTVVDGFKGGIISGRAPQREDRRIPYMLIICIFLALPLGKLLSLTRTLLASKGDAMKYLMMSMARAPYIFILFGLLFSFLFFSFLAFAWEEFRYGGEVVFSLSDVSVIKINRPPVTWPERIVKWIDRVISFKE